MNCTCHLNGYADGAYTLPNLGYDPASMEDFLDEQTILLHHGRHHDAYVKGANAATEQLRELAHGGRAIDYAASLTQALAFNLAGHILHSVYWKSISPMPHNTPEGALAEAINESYANYEGFVRVFTQLANSMQGSGWVVLGVDRMSQRLILCAIQKHQDALTPGLIPLLACDLWEHAYYLRYQQNRAGYIDAFVKQLDWTYAQQQFAACQAPSPQPPCHDTAIADAPSPLS